MREFTLRQRYHAIRPIDASRFIGLIREEEDTRFSLWLATERGPIEQIWQNPRDTAWKVHRWSWQLPGINGGDFFAVGPKLLQWDSAQEKWQNKLALPGLPELHILDVGTKSGDVFSPGKIGIRKTVYDITPASVIPDFSEFDISERIETWQHCRGINALFIVSSLWLDASLLMQPKLDSPLLAILQERYHADRGRRDIFVPDYNDYETPKLSAILCYRLTPEESQVKLVWMSSRPQAYRITSSPLAAYALAFALRHRWITDDLDMIEESGLQHLSQDELSLWSLTADSSGSRSLEVHEREIKMDGKTFYNDQHPKLVACDYSEDEGCAWFFSRHDNRDGRRVLVLDRD